MLMFCCCCCCSNVRFFRFLARKLVTHTKLYKQLLKTAMMVMIMVKLMKWMKGKNGQTFDLCRVDSQLLIQSFRGKAQPEERGTGARISGNTHTHTYIHNTYAQTLIDQTSPDHLFHLLFLLVSDPVSQLRVRAQVRVGAPKAESHTRKRTEEERRNTTVVIFRSLLFFSYLLSRWEYLAHPHLTHFRKKKMTTIHFITAPKQIPQPMHR